MLVVLSNSSILKIHMYSSRRQEGTELSINGAPHYSFPLFYCCLKVETSIIRALTLLMEAGLNLFLLA
jgi:hypothetical protein